MRNLLFASLIALAPACGAVETQSAPDAVIPDAAIQEPDAGEQFLDAGTELPDAGPAFDYAASLTADFAFRDTLPQTDVAEPEWFSKSSWGPDPEGGADFIIDSTEDAVDGVAVRRFQGWKKKQYSHARRIFE
jgi:hypothetical protein